MEDVKNQGYGNGPFETAAGSARRRWLRGVGRTGLAAGLLAGGLTRGFAQLPSGASWGTSQPVSSVDRIGLLLPKSDGPLGRAHAAVRAGIEVGYRRDGQGLAVDIYEVDDSARSLMAAYRGMLQRGTALTLGPLTRSGANLLLELGEVPITTIALNQIDGDNALPWNVLMFSLAAEQESLQLADIAFQSVRASLAADRPPRATIVAATSQIGRRAAGTFYERWRTLGGTAELPIELEESALYKFRGLVKAENQDLWFLSMAPQLARPVRIIIGRGQPVYGTSLLSVGGSESTTRAPELEGARLLEMPVMIQPQLYSMLGYPAAPPDYTLEMQRLYAMGIDAFRVARAMFSGRGGFDIDGLTGRLRYDGSQPRIQRLASLAEYRDGVPGAVL